MTPDQLLAAVVVGPRGVLLHRHRRLGLWLQPGGHIEPGETPAEAAAREVKEESGIHVSPAALTEAAHLTFLFPARPDWDMTVAIFTAGTWSGDPAETEEIRPEWFPVAALPYDQMWDDAPRWLPRVLSGERLRAAFSYAPDNETVASASVEPY